MVSTSRSDPERIIKITLHGATDLVKRDLFTLPNPFAVLTVDGEQPNLTAIVSKNLSPVWNETFEINVRRSSLIKIQIFDNRKFRRRDQGFLGVCNILAADAIQSAGDPSVPITRDLTKSSDSRPIHGHISLSFSFPPMLQLSSPSMPMPTVEADQNRIQSN